MFGYNSCHPTRLEKVAALQVILRRDAVQLLVLLNNPNRYEADLFLDITGAREAVVHPGRAERVLAPAPAFWAQGGSACAVRIQAGSAYGDHICA
jgi:hypothetical protein